MSGYGRFALYYDSLTQNVDYEGRATFFDTLIKARFQEPGLLLDLACGTGSLALELSRLGYDVLGADVSEDMLGMAMQKQHLFAGPVMFLRQSAEELDLYGTVDACVCTLDSLNHLPDVNTLAKAIGRVSLFLNPNGIFIFDVNTLYKHKHVLASNAFVYESGNVYCVWRNDYNADDHSVEIALDFFEKTGNGNYKRYNESFAEHYYSTECILNLLENNGLELIGMYDGDTFAKPSESSERLLFVAGKGR